MRKSTDIDHDRFREACENYEGWCIICKRFTRDQTEPDAHDYLCPECNTNSCMGAEDALLSGEIDIE